MFETGDRVSYHPVGFDSIPRDGMIVGTVWDGGYMVYYVDLDSGSHNWGYEPQFTMIESYAARMVRKASEYAAVTPCQ